MGKINAALSDARAEVVQLTADVAEKEAILAEVKKAMLAEQEQLMQKVPPNVSIFEVLSLTTLPLKEMTDATVFNSFVT